MACAPEETQSPEHSALLKNSSKLCDGITTISTITHFAQSLEERSFITSNASNSILTTCCSDYDKCARLLQAVKQQVRTNPRMFETFVDILKQEPAFICYTDMLITSRDIEAQKCTSIHNGSFSSSSPPPVLPCDVVSQPASEFAKAMSDLTVILQRNSDALEKMQVAFEQIAHHMKNPTYIAIIESRQYEAVNSVRAFFRILAPHWKPIDCSLLKALVHAAGVEEATQRLEAYISMSNCFQLGNGSEEVYVPEDRDNTPQYVPNSSTSDEIISQPHRDLALVPVTTVVAVRQMSWGSLRHIQYLLSGILGVSSFAMPYSENEPGSIVIKCITSMEILSHIRSTQLDDSDMGLLLYQKIVSIRIGKDYAIVVGNQDYWMAYSMNTQENKTLSCIEKVSSVKPDELHASYQFINNGAVAIMAEEDVDSDEEISFGPRSPPLTDQIASVLRRYPDGGQILKELIQNADDAGATEVRFLLDPRQHSTENLLEHQLAQYQGPALYAWNDAVFKREDWQCLAKIEQSGKEKEVLKVGRFGLGFLSVFHITDLPVVISKKHVGIADPHEHLQLVSQDKGNRAGIMVKLAEFMKCQGHAACLHGVFGMTADTGNYDSTLFRFPLRPKNSNSKIAPDGYYTTDKVRDNLFLSLQTEAPILLLFLKHILKVSMYEWREDSQEPVCTFSVQISDNVTQDRKKCTSLAEAYTNSSVKVSAVLTSATTTCHSHVKEESNHHHWLILNSIGSDLADLRLRADKTNVLPWVGIAAQAPMKFNFEEQIVLDNLGRVSDVKSIERVLLTVQNLLRKCACEGQAPAPVDSNPAGQAFCFLPLPGNISLPVNIHGYFAVADNRRSIKWPSHDEKGAEAKWNEILLHKLISPLYTLLLVCRSCLIKYRGTSIGKPITDAYAAWPVYAEVKNQQIWSEILEPVLTQIVNLPVLWTEACGGAWVAPSEAFFINPEEWCPQIALKVLMKLGYNVVSLPAQILETMFRNEEMERTISTRYVTAKVVQSAMKNKKGILHSVPKQHIHELLEYMLSYLPDCSMLIGLEVLPLCDGSLYQFTGNRRSRMVFVFPERCRDCLQFLPGIASSVVQTNIPFSLQEKLEEISKTKQLELELVNHDIICSQLIKLSMKSWCPNLEYMCVWQPGQCNHPPMEWIVNVWSWIRTHQAVYQVTSVPIVPEEVVTASTKQVRLLPLDTRPALCTLPHNLPQQCPLKVMLKIVEMLGLVHVQESSYVSECSGTDNYIKVCDAIFLLQHIKNKLKVFSKKLSIAKADALCHFIACDLYSYSMSSQDANIIEHLPIFRAGVGCSPSRCISLNSGKFVLPPRGIEFKDDIEYPPGILCDKDVRVTALLERLKVERSRTIDDFCEDVILPFVTTKREWSTNDDRLIMWMLQLPLANPNFLQNFSIIRPCISSHGRMKPIELYDPTETVFRKLFDSRSEAAFPAHDYKPMLHILRLAGLNTWSNLRSNHEQLIKFLVDRARSVSTMTRSDGLQRSKYLLRYVLEMKLLQHPQLCEVKFLYPEVTPPSNYPSNLKWYSSHKPQALCPKDISCHSLHSFLVGSVIPILSSEYEIQLQGKHSGFHGVTIEDVTTEDVVRHFKEVVSYVSRMNSKMTESDTSKVNDMVIKIYHFLSKTKRISDFPNQWIWWRSRKVFLKSEQCLVTLPSEIATLEPYLFSLSLNHELQTHVLSLHSKLPEVCLHQSLSEEDAITVLTMMDYPKGRHLNTEEVTMAISILRWLKNHNHTTHGNLLMPTDKSTLALLSECTYDDRNWKTSAPQALKYTFVHGDIPPTLAKYFHVTPLSQKVAPSKALKLKYTKAGQREPITRRIRRIVEGYGTNSDIFKELLQNADDAQAREVKFLIDWREHSTSSLLSNELHHWQGPALVAYNDAMFSDQDFEHICEVAAETKMKDPLKTGRFGVGFCATYHLTDVPSFISRHYFTMFDPHTCYLGDRVSPGQPGIRIDLVENRDDLLVYADQFQPYDGLFGCDVFNLPAEGFRGTMFRFPFRTSLTARRSSICHEVNDRRSVETLLKIFKEQAQYLLLFLKHVRKVSVFVQENNVTRMKKILCIEKTCKCLDTCNRLSLISSHLHSSKYPLKCECQCEVKFTEGEQFKDSSQWIISSAVDTTKGLNVRSQGLIPFAEVAMKVQKQENQTLFPLSIEGYLFCFLPLPMKTELPFHVNGFFDISHDRSSLKSSDDERFGKKWNELLCKGALMQAYIEALSVLTNMSPLPQIKHCKEEKSKYLEAFYDMLRLSDKSGLIGQNLCSSVKNSLPETESKLVWSDVSGGKWMQPRHVVLLDLEVYAKQMQESTVEVLLEFQYNICQPPFHFVRLLIDFLTKHQVYNYCKFCTQILIPKIAEISNERREKHIVFLLKNLDRFTWITPLLKNKHCIPVKSSTKLVPPEHLIDERELLLKSLYDTEEARFPADFLKGDYVMASLSQLGMMKKLSEHEIKGRALTVRNIEVFDRDKAAKRCWTLIEYIQKHWLPRYTFCVTRNDTLCSILGQVPFLPAAQKAQQLKVPWCERDSLLTPLEVFTPNCNNLIFSVRPVVKQPVECHLHSDILVLLGASQDPPLKCVLSHLTCLSQGLKMLNSESDAVFITEAMSDIYKYLLRMLKVSSEEIDSAKFQLQEMEFIWQEGRFLKLEQVVLKWDHNCYPYLCELSAENKKYQDLFDRLGIKQEPLVNDLVVILRKIAGQYALEDEQKGPQSVDSEQLTFIEEIVKKLFQLVDSNNVEPPENIYLPDEENIMRPVKQLACDKIETDKGDWVHSMQIFTSQFEGGKCRFLHSSIPRERAIALGVKPLLDALVQGLEDDDFFKGTDFGQHEDLCDRLKSILKKYPADYSILNEFIQNADDAQATEIVFVLDHRKFSQAKLFPSKHQSWKDLQHTPALCVINNCKFTENDIKGIAQLGRGAKSDFSDTIGRFGIGFNAAYHVTDCPSFVSFSETRDPENFCVLDPTCSFAPYANKQSPGKRWKLSNTPHVVADLPDQFQPYLLHQLPNFILDDIGKGHVVFRLPLTREKYRYSHQHTGSAKNRLGYAKFDAEKVSQLFKKMEEYAQDTLLFLNHVVKISALEIKENENGHVSITKHFSTEVHLSAKDLDNCHTFAKKVKEMTEGQREPTEITMTHKTNVLHQVPMDHAHENETVQWLICRKYVPINAQQEENADPREQGVEWNMRPVGGIAAAIGKTNTYGRLFCFLPMPFESKLPVHVNGHFLIDDSRKHLECERFKWNIHLTVEVIAPCYVDILLHAQQMAERGEADPNWFYSLFPSLSLKGEVGNLKLSEEVYKILLDKNSTILLQTHPDTNFMKWFSLSGPDMGYFFLDFVSEDTNKMVEADYTLQSALIRLGMHITTEEVPCSLYENLCQIEDEYSTLALVDHHKIVNHLRRVDFSQPTVKVILNNKIIQLLLDLLLNGMKVDDVKETLETVPLLLSLDGNLWKGKQIFKSVHASLLPHHSSRFIQKELEESSVGKKLMETEYEIIVDLPVEFVAENLDLPDTSEPIRIYDASFETLKCIKRLWMYLRLSCFSPFFTPSQPSDLIQTYFLNKQLLPADDGHLYPVCLENTLVSSEGGNDDIRSTLKRLGYPTVSFDELKVRTPSTHLGNKCNNGGDIIECFKMKFPPIYDAHLTPEEVRAIIENVRQHKHLLSIARTLQDLKIFQTIDEQFISMKGNPQVYIMPQGIPTDGMEDIQLKARTNWNSVILKGTDEFTMQFYNRVLFLNQISAANVLKFYKQVILPNIQALQIEQLQAHLSYIWVSKDLKGDVGLMQLLRHAKIIELEDGMFSVTEICDRQNTFFKTFCGNRLLPDAWGQNWLPFFKELGLRHKVCFDEWKEHAQLFANDNQHLSISSKRDKSEALLETLFQIIEDEDEDGFESLQEASTIEFIYNTSTPHLIELIQLVFWRTHQWKKPQKEFFCFEESVFTLESDLAALCKYILPKCCEEKLMKNRAVVNCLGIESPLQPTTIEMNLIMLSEMYTGLQSSQHHKYTDNLRTILIEHYAALDKIRNLHNSGIDIYRLRKTLCIAVTPSGSHQGLVLIKPSQLVMSLPSDINVEPFCYKVPPDISQYTHLWEVLKVPIELTALKCAQILHKIYQQLKQVNQSLSKNDKYKRVSLDAYNHMVSVLRKEDEDLPSTLYLPSEDDELAPNFPSTPYLPSEDDELVPSTPYLPSEDDKLVPNFPSTLYLPSEDDELVPNSELLFNDAPWYAQRLPKDEVFQFLKLPLPNEKGEKVPPDSLGVKWLTSVISEELHEDMFSSDFSCTDEERYAKELSTARCSYVQKVYDTLTAPELKKGLCRIYFSERRERPSEQFEAAIDKLVNVHVKCVTSDAVITVLKKDSVVVPDSQSSDKLSYASIERNILVISPHCYFNEMDFIKSLSSALKMFCHNEIKNEAHIMAMIQCDPSEIEAELDKNEVSRYDPTFLKETKYHEIGDETPLETLLLKNCLVILNFSIGEKAYYYDCGGNTLKIAAVRDIHNCDENFWESTVTLEVRNEDEDDEENACISVSPFFIFKLLTPSEHILLFSDDQESSSARATAEPVHLADIRPEEDNITEFLTSPFFCDTTRAQVAMIMTRLICHLHYRLSKESKSTLLLGTKMINFLQHFSALDLYDINANEILRIALSLTLPMHVSLEIPIQEYTSDGYTCSVGHTHMPQLGTHLQAPPPQRRNQQPMNYQPRFQPRQRRGYQTQYSYRFQPQVTSAEPQKPPTSDKDAQIWLDQAKADYRAAAYLIEGMTITPTIVPRPQECQIFPDNEEGEGMEATYNEQDETNLESADSSESVVESMEEYERGGQLLEQSSPQFPYLVCFLCHEAVEKCLKGVLYAYCGLKPELLNCSSLVLLYEEMKSSSHCPRNLMAPIEQCVMQINEHENKSRLPNYHIPPCAPATVYTAINSNEAFLSTRELFNHVQADPKVASMLGDLEEIPKPKFISMLKSLAGSEEEYPDYWDLHRNNENFMMVPLPIESEEFQQIAERLYSTMPNIDIKRIDRIQNRVLWKKYFDKSSEMCKFGNGVLHEQLLFHGSRNNDPELIYKGDAGFDIRFSNTGMWGKGNYFAVNALYCNGYAFSTGSSTTTRKKILAAWVLTGHSFHSEPNPQLKYPPYREETDGEVHEVRRRYDSVSGTTGGTKVYITYDNTLAYPAYLITYI